MQVGNPAIGTDKAIASEQSQRNQLNRAIAADNKEIASLNTIARDECNGVSGKGLSGIVGVGPNCTRDRQKADSFTSASDVAELQSQVTSLETKIASADGRRGERDTGLRDEHLHRHHATCHDQEAARRAHRPAQPHRRPRRTGFHAFRHCGRRGPAGYLHHHRRLPSRAVEDDERHEHGMTTSWSFGLGVAERMAAEAMKVTERRATSRHEIELNKIETRVRAELERIDEDSRFDRAEREAALDRKIAYLAAEYRRLADMEGSSV